MVFTLKWLVSFSIVTKAFWEHSMKTDFCANIYLLARVYYNNRLYMCDRERERGLNYQRSVCEQRVSIKERERERERECAPNFAGACV